MVKDIFYKNLKKITVFKVYRLLSNYTVKYNGIINSDTTTGKKIEEYIKYIDVHSAIVRCAVFRFTIKSQNLSAAFDHTLRGMMG